MISHPDTRYPNKTFSELPFINAKLLFISKKTTEELRTGDDNLVEQHPIILGGSDGCLRDTLVDFDMKDMVNLEKLAKKHSGSIGHVFLVVKSTDPEIPYELSCYSNAPCRIFESFDSEKNVIDAALVSAYKSKIREDLNLGKVP